MDKILARLALKGWTVRVSSPRFLLATKTTSTMIAMFDKNGVLTFSALNGKKQANAATLIAGIL